MQVKLVLGLGTYVVVCMYVIMYLSTLYLQKSNHLLSTSYRQPSGLETGDGKVKHFWIFDMNHQQVHDHDPLL